MHSDRQIIIFQKVGGRYCFHLHSSEQIYVKSIIKQRAGSKIVVLCAFVFRLAVQRLKMLGGMGEAR